jgi:DNA-binding SARP family transcriptional activator/Tfp pilus assembly protein PilF
MLQDHPGCANEHRDTGWEVEPHAGWPAGWIMQRMEFRVLGPVEVWCDGRRVPVLAAKQRTLLAILLLRAGRVVAAEELIDRLWGERPPTSARKTLHNYVRRLRTTLAAGADAVAVPPMLRTEPSGYLLRLGDAELDLHRFERLREQAQQATAAGDPDRAAAILHQALGLWRGSALADVAAETLLRTEAARLEEQRLAALEARIHAELELGRHAELVGELEALAAQHPLRESFRAQLMLALYRSGRQAEALAAYRELRRRLVEELAVEPGRPLQELEHQILTGDSALDLAAEPTSGPAATTPALVPRQLPPDIATFTGRTQELGRLKRMLTATNQTAAVVISAIQGAGGIGKSALAVHAAHQLAERFPDGHLYVNLHGTTTATGLQPLDPLEVLGQFLRALHMDPAQIPTQVAEAAGLFRTLVVGRRLLVVLDNAASVEQVRPLLPASSTCGVLVTSRQLLATLAGAQVLHLDVLPHKQAVELLGRIVGQQRINAEPQAAAEVVGWCGYLPLAIQIAGARLAARPTWPIRELARRLADATRRLDELAAGNLGVRASFDVSLYSLHHSPDPVDQAAAHAFGLLGLPDGPDLGVAGAARLLDESDTTAEALLERLVDAHLLQTPRPGRYQFHDLMRLYARQHAATNHPESERLAALERLFGLYTATAWYTLGLLRPGDHRLMVADPRWTSGGLQVLDTAAALQWLEAERGNLLAAIAQTAAIAPAIPPQLATELSCGLRGFFEVHCRWADEVWANRTALELACRTADRKGQASAHNNLGTAYERLGRYPEALEQLQQALALFQELEDRHSQAASLTNLGIVYWRLGHHVGALEHHQQALIIYGELGDHRGQAVSLSNLGIVDVEFGRHTEALEHHQQALIIYRELGDGHSQAQSLNNLGEVLERLGRYPEALEHHEHAFALDRELGDRWGQADCLTNLGVVFERLGRHLEAIDHHHQALNLFRELGDRWGQAETLQDLGAALLGLGRHQQAREAWQEALELCKVLKIPEPGDVRARLTELPTSQPGTGV